MQISFIRSTLQRCTYISSYITWETKPRTLALQAHVLVFELQALVCALKEVV